MQEELKSILNKKPNIDDAFKLRLNIQELGKKENEILEKRTNDFSSRISDIVKPHHTAKEMVENIVKAALEVEYGPSFTVSKGFRSMISKIADVIITNPDLRRQALSIASNQIEIKKAVEKQNDRNKKN